MLVSGSKEALQYAETWSLVLIANEVIHQAIKESTRYLWDPASKTVINTTILNDRFVTDSPMMPKSLSQYFPEEIDVGPEARMRNSQHLQFKAGNGKGLGKDTNYPPKIPYGSQQSFNPGFNFAPFGPRFTPRGKGLVQANGPC